MIGILIPFLLLIPTPVKACSPRLDGEPTYCPDWDDVLVREFEETITDKSFDEEFPDAFTHRVTLYDTRVAHMGHDFPTWPTAGEMIQAIREQEAEANRISIDEMIDASLIDYSDQTINEE